MNALENHQWLYDSEYYQKLLDRARLTDQTQQTSRDNRITLQLTCINRWLLWCKLLDASFVPNVYNRTNGRVKVELTSFPELGLEGVNTASLLPDGALEMSEIYGGYVGGEFPTLAVQYLWGLWPDHQTHFAVQDSIAPEIDRTIADEMGARVLMRNWIAGDDQFIFSDHRLNSPQDFHGLKTGSHSAELSDWLNHMGAEAQYMPFAEGYTVLKQGILDAAVTGPNRGLGQRWYEVAHYMNGPLTSFNSIPIAINDQVWASIPGDLQQILIEEGAKYELETLRLASIHNVTGIRRNVDAGLEFVEFSPKIRQLSFISAMESVIPNWLRRLGYPDSGNETVRVFNDRVGPYVGLHIERDGSVTISSITRGPHAGKTMEQVLAE